MATREENLKKINDALEQMSDEDLEKVAGGTPAETADDSRFLNVLLQGTSYHHCDRYGKTRICFDWDAKDDVIAAWKSLGIDLLDKGYPLSNEYYLNGQQITQGQAWDYAEKVVGRHLSRVDWEW